MLFSFLLLLLAQPVLPELISQKSKYDVGLDWLRKDSVELALQYWYSAKFDLHEEIDPKIGIHFAHVVTEKELKRFYPQASEMFYWALESEKNPHDYEPLYEFLYATTIPILKESDLEILDKAYRSKSPVLLELLKRYWIAEDPTPSTKSNERLLEHLGRIHLTNNYLALEPRGDISYSGDPRAETILKHGLPTERIQGSFSLDDLKIRAWIEQILEIQDLRAGGSPPGGGGGGGRSVDPVDAISRYSRSLFNYPNYEVWFYDAIRDEAGSYIPIMFGQSTEDNTFRRITGMQELVPKTAYRSREFQTGIRDLTPGILLQLSFYEQVASLHPSFARSFMDFESTLYSAGGINNDVGRQFARQQSNEYRNVAQSIPEETSSENDLETIKIQIKDFQLLDVEGNPEAILVMESNVAYPFLEDVTVYETQFEHYQLIHNITVRGPAFDTLFFQRYVVPTQQLVPFLLEDGARPQSVYNIQNVTGVDLSYKASTELLNVEDTSLQPKNELYPAFVRAVGHQEFAISKPLKVEKDQPLLGDLMLGFNLRDSEERFPFDISLSNAFSIQENPVLHFEVYNLSAGQNSEGHHYSTTVSVFKYGGLFDWFKSKAKISTRLDYKPTQNVDRQTMVLDSPALKQAGDYVILVEVVDENTGRKTSKDIRLTFYEGNINFDQ